MASASAVDDGEDDASQPDDSKSNTRSQKVKIDADKNVGGSAGKGRTKWSKYCKRYKPQWETLDVFASWLHRTPEHLIAMGKPEAYCAVCRQCLRAHKSDLMAHAKSKKHKEAERTSTTPRDCRSFIESYVPDQDEPDEVAIIEPANEDSSDPPNKRSRGRSSKRIANKAAVIQQITQELEETDEKIHVCEEELNNLRIKKARLEFEYGYYNSHD